MLPKDHIYIGTIVFLVLIVLGVPTLAAAIVFAASVLVDFDHVVGYLIKFKRFNWKDANRYYRRRRNYWENHYELPIFIFHNIETFIVLIILTFIFPFPFFLILVGLSIHMFVDLFVLFTKHIHCYPPVIKMSLIGVIGENRSRKLIAKQKGNQLIR